MQESGRRHVVVLLAVTSQAVHLFDPAVGHYWLSRDQFADRWLGDRTAGLLVALTSTSAPAELD
jgi:predicted double-glycine peptidase